MSSAFENIGFNIHQDGAENAARKTKRDDMQGKPPANKRAALGTLTNVSNTRVQPHRAAKQGLSSESCPQQENVFPKALGKAPTLQSTNPFSIAPSQPFAIHVDKNASTNVSESSTVRLHPAVTSLRQPLSTVSENISIDEHCPRPEDSPMLLDEYDDSEVELSEKDIKEQRLNKILTVPDYSEDIYAYLREAELRNRPKPTYMKKQPDITNSMRSILIDWLVEVAEEYNLHRETLCLAVNYIDRFLSQMSVVRGKLQLVGAASMFLAAKYEEIYPPEVTEFVYITDDTYTAKQILRMEHLVLKVLSFDVAVPTVNCFCEKFLKDLNASDKASALAMYLSEMTMVDAEPFLNYLPSVIAASAVCLSNITLEETPWPQVMVDTTSYRMSDLQDCIQHLYAAFCRAPNHPQQAIREKYKSDKFHQVALLSPPPLLPLV